MFNFRKQKAARKPLFCLSNRATSLLVGTVQGTHDIAENVTDSRAENGQDHDDDQRNQYQDQSIFDEALAFFILGTIQHDDYLL